MARNQVGSGEKNFRAASLVAHRRVGCARASSQGELEQKYVDLLGSSYERIMGDVEKVKTSS